MNNWLTTNAYRPLRNQLDLSIDPPSSKDQRDQRVGAVARRCLEALDIQKDVVSQKAISNERISNLRLGSKSQQIKSLVQGVLAKQKTHRAETRRDRELFLSENILSSDWEARSLLPIDYSMPFEAPPGAYFPRSEFSADKKPPSPLFEKKQIYKAIDLINIAASAISFAFSFISTSIKWATHAISPLSTAIPFIGLFNGLANGFAFGKGIERLHFYSNLKKELSVGRYDATLRNFGKYSAALLTKYPQLADREISPSRLLAFLKSEVRRKQIKYGFVMTSKVLGVGAAVVSFLGGLAAFAIPIFAFPALFIGLPLAILSFGIGIAGNQIAHALRDPLLRKTQVVDLK